ncbi:MAG TPA: M48 family metallopeptidase [Candidatus Saccharimonadales bacterium]|nr:M48 family metallopeptidase [Candidatus Saccharimonadales bacterium]
MAKDVTKGRLAVQRAFSTSDIVVLAITFVVFFLASSTYFIINYFTNDMSGSDTADIIMVGIIGTIIGAGVLFGVALVVGMFMVRLQRQVMLGNSLQVEYSAYAWLRDWANEVSADLEMPRVEIFVTQDPVINAYSFGFARPYAIVLQSGTIRYLSKDELKVVLVHEMAHIKYGHVNAAVYLQPFMAVPVLGAIFTWLAGFWQRRTEFTADRLALMYMQDSELVKQALIKVHVGPDVASSMNDIARQWLQYTAERPMNHLAQTFSNHPFLVRRISRIDERKHIVEPVTSQTQKPVA